ncbi:MAG: sulfotransferase family 2 domain-containing protein [Chloroflexi bacterium]|nr:sulfotransferase family 2 domain-containing protein [Chloroflexota bacterium]
MIISHTHKYVFVALPQTGSTAISHELRQQYGGEKILFKHATYENFLKIATPEEKEYFVFSCVRNPLDYAVSQYFKYVTDHKHKYTDPDNLKRLRGIVAQMYRQRFEFVRQQQPTFPAYFKRYYRTPYSNWSSLSHKKFDFIIRFERLQQDFAEALQRIGIEPVRPLPRTNPTRQKSQNFLSYYTPDIREHAKWVFGPYMKQWGYEFPPEWGETRISSWNQLQFDFFNAFRIVYWKYLRNRI